MYNILFVLTPSFNPNSGGVQRTTYKLGKYFANKGHRVSYYSFATEGHIETINGKLYHSQVPGGVDEGKNLKTLEEVCSGLNPDIVINQMPYEYLLTELLGKIKNKYGFILLGCLRNSLFSVINNIEASMKSLLPRPLFQMLNNPIGKKLAHLRHKHLHKKSLRHIISNHDRYILLSPPNNKELKYFVGDYMQEKILAIPNSIPDVYTDLSEKNKTIIHVGRLTKTQKRSELLLPFWKACKDDLNDWEFVIVGDGPYMEEMKIQINKQNIERVKLTGFQKPETYYKSASIFMMPSAYEGFPNTILEAHSYACPVLAYNSYDALEWIVNDGEDSCLIEPYNVAKMAKMAIALAEDSERLLKFQKAALQNASRFTIDKVGKIWEDLFEELVRE